MKLTKLILAAVCLIFLVGQASGQIGPPGGGGAVSPGLAGNIGIYSAPGSTISPATTLPAQVQANISSNGRLNITNASIGMAAGGADNYPQVPALMTAISPNPSIRSGGPTVIFPAVIGQSYSGYYFSGPLEMSRGANVTCESVLGQNTYTALVFAAGVDGFVQQSFNTTLDSGSGAGSINNCGIYSLSLGQAVATNGSATITSATNNGYGTGTGSIAAQPWQNGDAIIAYSKVLQRFTLTGWIAGSSYTGSISGTALTTPASNTIISAGLSRTASASAVLLCSPCNVVVGNHIVISGATPSTYNGSWPVTASTLNTSVTFTTGTNTTDTSSGEAVATVSAPGTQDPVIGQPVDDASGLVLPGTIITAGSGTAWTVNLTQTVASEAMYDPLIQGTILTVTTCCAGPSGSAIATGQVIASASTNNSIQKASGAPLTVTALGSGTGGVGTYTISLSQIAPSQALVALPATDNITAPGAYLDPTTGVSGATLTLASPYVAQFAQSTTATAIETWRLPATLKYVVTTSGIVNSINTLVGGSGGTPATYPRVSLTGGTGSGASATIVVSGSGAVTALPTIIDFGTGYTVNDVLTASPGGLSGFSITVATNTGTGVQIASGPRPLVQGDMIWGDFAKFGTSIHTVNGLTFPQSVRLSGVTLTLTIPANTTVAHTLGSGQMWEIPAGIKHRLQANSSYNFIQGWPIGLDIPCNASSWPGGGFNPSNSSGLNCTHSIDQGNFYQFNIIGRLTRGDNTGASSSIAEEGAKNLWADVVEAGTLGSNYSGLLSETTEDGFGFYGTLVNCANQNTSVFYSAYISAAANAGPSCLSPTAGISGPPEKGSGLLQIGNLSSVSTDTTSINSGFMGGCWRFGLSQQSFNLNCSGNIYTMTSNGGAPTNNNYTMYYNIATGSYDLMYDNATSRVVERLTGGGSTPYTGYLGDGFGYPVHPRGVLVSAKNGAPGTERMIQALATKPTDTSNLQGDITFNTAAVPGGNAAWVDAPSFTTTLSGAVTKGTTTIVTVAACPAVALPAATPIVDSTPSTDVLLGTLTSCTSTTLTFQAAAANNGTSGDTIQFMQEMPVMTVQGGPNPILSTGGCIGTPLAGGLTNGTFTAASCVANFYIISGLPSSPGGNGWNCFATDRTTIADTLAQTASTLTSATMSGTTAASDVIGFRCDWY